MTDTQLYSKINSLPDHLKEEVIDFIDFLRSRAETIKLNNGKKRIFGYAKDTIVIKPEFDEPLEEFLDYM
jgi:hypothetical protein